MTVRQIARESFVEDAQARTTAPAVEAHDHADASGHEHRFEWNGDGAHRDCCHHECGRYGSGFGALSKRQCYRGGRPADWRWPIFKEAFLNLISRMTMELSMTIAIVAAASIGEFFTALVISLFVLVAEVLERMTVSRGRHAIRDLLDFLPRSVSVRRAMACGISMWTS